MRDCHLPSSTIDIIPNIGIISMVARTCDNEVGVAISIRDRIHRRSRAGANSLAVFYWSAVCITKSTSKTASPMTTNTRLTQFYYNYSKPSKYTANKKGERIPCLTPLDTQNGSDKMISNTHPYLCLTPRKKKMKNCQGQSLLH